MGMFAVDRICRRTATMHKVASAASYVLDGKCVRTAKDRALPRDRTDERFGWRITRPDGSEVSRELWTCVPGTPPMSHAELLREIAEGGQASVTPNRRVTFPQTPASQNAELWRALKRRASRDSSEALGSM